MQAIPLAQSLRARSPVADGYGAPTAASAAYPFHLRAGRGFYFQMPNAGGAVPLAVACLGYADAFAWSCSLDMNDAADPKDCITLAGGCFWCLEAVFERVQGVLSVESGYSNGHVERPSYEQVCSGRTGHAEAVRVCFDAEQISLRAILEIFFAVHDATSLNRQGADIGTQYRSGIYYRDAEQERVAREVFDEAQAALGGRAVTELQPERNYWPAETYHQRYYARNPEQGYCVFVVAAKVDKFLSTFSQYARKTA